MPSTRPAEPNTEARAQLHHLPHAMAQGGFHHFHGAEQVDGEDIRGRVLFALQAGGDGRAMHHAIDGMLAQGGVQVRAAAYVAKLRWTVSPADAPWPRWPRPARGGPERHDVFAASKQLLDEVQADKPRPTVTSTDMISCSVSGGRSTWARPPVSINRR